MKLKALFLSLAIAGALNLVSSFAPANAQQQANVVNSGKFTYHVKGGTGLLVSLPS